MYRIGFVINPVAGMGGAVGLKGTDGRVAEAKALGAIPRAGNRAKITLGLLKKEQDLLFLTCSGEMGENVLAGAGIPATGLCLPASARVPRTIQKLPCRNSLTKVWISSSSAGGTGRRGTFSPFLGGRFPCSEYPRGREDVLGSFCDHSRCGGGTGLPDREAISLRDAEIMDVDEEAYRSGVLDTRLYGVARVPALAGRVQVSKQVFEEADEERAKDEIARFIHEVMLPDTLYILGAGTTTEAIARNLGVPKTLLGVDVIKNGMMVTQDADEKTLLELVETEKDIRIIISPIGAQGFILGRGNQQISAAIVRTCGNTEYYRCRHAAQTSGDTGTAGGYR